MSKPWPTMPSDCMGVSVFAHPDYPDAAAYCTQKGCIGCCIKTRVVLDATRESTLKTLRARILTDIRARCWKGATGCYPQDCLKTLPAPILRTINDPPIEMLRYLNGEDGHRHDAICTIADYATTDEAAREDINDWCTLLTAHWYRELHKV